MTDTPEPSPVFQTIIETHPTTVREIAKTVGLSSTTVWYHLEALRDEGLVTWEKGKARTIRPT